MNNVAISYTLKYGTGLNHISNKVLHDKLFAMFNDLLRVAIKSGNEEGLMAFASLILVFQELDKIIEKSGPHASRHLQEALLKTDDSICKNLIASRLLAETTSILLAFYLLGDFESFKIKGDALNLIVKLRPDSTLEEVRKNATASIKSQPLFIESQPKASGSRRELEYRLTKAGITECETIIQNFRVAALITK